MFVLKLILKNALRHKLRTVLTILGIAIAVMSFVFPPDHRHGLVVRR